MEYNETDMCVTYCYFFTIIVIMIIVWANTGCNNPANNITANNITEIVKALNNSNTQI